MYKEDLFEEMPIHSALIRLALPAVIGQIIMVLYNMADTFFIGLTDNNVKLTAVTICMPAFMALTAIANLFGVGGTSVISRALGKKNFDRASSTSAFSHRHKNGGCPSRAVPFLYGVCSMRMTC